jgi:hypothetical protein
MIVGNPSIFAIESSITTAYERPSFRALGFFVIFVDGKMYGQRTPDSTMLACSYGEVVRRIGQHGKHDVCFSMADGGEIAWAFRSVFYSENTLDTFFGISSSAFGEMIKTKHVVWAPDGDEAFDDGSYILQFDFENKVRLIAFKSTKEQLYDPSSLSDVWLTADSFYKVLKQWVEAFDAEWRSLPKV